MTTDPIQLPQQSNVIHRQRFVIALASGLIATAFVLAVTAIMIGSFLREQRTNPLTDGTLTNLKEQLQRNSEDEQLKAQIRQADLKVRQSFFQRRSFVQRGAYLLIGGGVVLIVAVKLVWMLGAEPYTPVANPLMRTNPRAVANRARTSVIAAAAITAGILIAIAVSPRYKTPVFAKLLPEAQPSIHPTDGAVDAPAPTDPMFQPAGEAVAPEMFLKNWPGFRGPSGTGIVATTDVEYPKDWDGASGKNIAWKTQVPLPGNNSPIVWGNQVFLTGADAKNREVYCFDATTGSLSWKQPVPTTPGAPPAEVSEDSTGYAPNTMACDGRRVFAIFPSCDLVCFDLSGKKLWTRSLGVPAGENNPYGHASSLLVCAGKVIVQLDLGALPAAGKSALFAFDAATGKPVWQAKRAVQVSWCSPIYVPPGPAGGNGQIITNGNPLAISYDPQTGAVLWQAKCLSGEVAPSPVYANGVAYVGVERADLSAIKADGKGDVTKTHILWKFPDDLPDITSPLATGEWVMLITTGGMLTCIDAKEGKSLWSQEVKGEFNASPSLVGQVVYLTDMAGVTHLIAADGKAFKEIGKPALGEEVKASPAFAGGKIFVRGKQNLYCIGSK